MLEKMVINGEEKTLYEDWLGSSLLSIFDYRAHCQDFRHQNFLNHYSAVFVSNPKRFVDIANCFGSFPT